MTFFGQLLNKINYILVSLKLRKVKYIPCLQNQDLEIKIDLKFSMWEVFQFKCIFSFILAEQLK